MKRRLILVAVLSLALGIVITSLFMGQLTPKNYGDCADRSAPLPPTVRRVECSGVSYGFPVRFLESEPSLAFDNFNTDPTQITVSASAASRFDKSDLLLNVAFWSVVSAVLVGGGWYWFSKRDDEKPAPEKPKK